MIALRGALGDLHIPEQGVHFGNRQAAIGAHRAVAGHGGQQLVGMLLQALGGAEFAEIGQHVAQQLLHVGIL